MSTTEEAPKKGSKAEKAEEQAVVEEQVAVPETRYVSISIDIATSVDNPDVTADQIGAAAAEQITLPNQLWVSAGLGQAAVTVLGATGTGSVDSGEQLSWEAGYGREAPPEE